MMICDAGSGGVSTIEIIKMITIAKRRLSLNYCDEINPSQPNAISRSGN
jgi:hypothetical protein